MFWVLNWLHKLFWRWYNSLCISLSKLKGTLKNFKEIKYTPFMLKKQLYTSKRCYDIWDKVKDLLGKDQELVGVAHGNKYIPTKIKFLWTYLHDDELAPEKNSMFNILNNTYRFSLQEW